MQAFIGQPNPGIKVLLPRCKVICTCRIIFSGNISPANAEGLGILCQPHQPFEFLRFRKECLNLRHLVQAGYIVDVAHLAAQCAANGMVPTDMTFSIFLMALSQALSDSSIPRKVRSMSSENRSMEPG